MFDGGWRWRACGESAQPLVALAFNAQTLDAVLGTFSPHGHYGDGLNLYVFGDANPLTRRDPMGLSWNDPFDEVDNFLFDMQAERSMALRDGVAFWRNMAKQAAIGAAQVAIAALVPGGTLIVGAWNMLDAGQDIYANGLNWSNGVQMGLSVSPFAKAATNRVLGRMSARRAQVRTATGGAYRSFTQSNFRYNLMVRTGFKAPPDIQAHHMLPVKFKTKFRKYGVKNIHDPKWGAWWDKRTHQLQSHHYNARWESS